MLGSYLSSTIQIKTSNTNWIQLSKVKCLHRLRIIESELRHCHEYDSIPPSPARVPCVSLSRTHKPEQLLNRFSTPSSPSAAPEAGPRRLLVYAATFAFDAAKTAEHARHQQRASRDSLTLLMVGRVTLPRYITTSPQEQNVISEQTVTYLFQCTSRLTSKLGGPM